MVLYSNIVANIFVPFRALLFQSSCIYKQPTMRTLKLYLYIIRQRPGAYLRREFPIIPPNLIALCFTSGIHTGKLAPDSFWRKRSEDALQQLTGS